MGYCFLNGKILEESKALLSVNNIGIQRGFGVFDLFRTRSGKPTFIQDYLSRFNNSQNFLNLDRIIDEDLILEAIDDLMRKNQYENSTFKLVLLGDGEDADEVFRPFFYILNRPINVVDEIQQANLITHQYIREYPVIKSLNYLISYTLHQRKREANAVDVLYYNNVSVSETSRSNVFIVKDGVLITPEKNILHGITRKHLLTIASSIMQVRVRDVKLVELQSADEVFISSTLKEIMPIVRIDGKAIGEGRVGAFTTKLRNAFRDYVASKS